MEPIENTPHPAETVAAVARVISKVGPIAKRGSGENKGRRIDDVIDELGDLIGGNGLAVIPSRIVSHETWEWEPTSKGSRRQKCRLVVEFTVWGPDGALTMVGVGEGVDTQDKGVGKAQSYAFKYALTQAFMVPFTERIDPEDFNEEPAAPVYPVLDRPGPHLPPALLEQLVKVFDAVDDQEAKISAKHDFAVTWGTDLTAIPLSDYTEAMKAALAATGSSKDLADKALAEAAEQAEQARDNQKGES